MPFAIENPSDLNPYILATIAVLAFGISCWLTGWVRDYAIGHGWLDMPDKRRVHRRPTPRIGGLGMFGGFLVAVLTGLLVGLFVPNFWRGEDVWRIGLLLLGATIITGVMFVDDLRGLQPLTKLAWQFGVASIVIIPQLFAAPGRPIGVLIESVADQPLWWLAIPFTFLWIVGVMNTVNLTDGLDGQAGGVVGVGAIILFLETIFQHRAGQDGFQFTTSILALALACAVGGFLVFNWHPASIFMGDCGSMFLGYTLAVISIIDGAKLAIALLVIGFPVLDAVFVALNRIYHGKSPIKADRNHLHHRLLDIGWSTPKIVLLFYGLSLLFGIIGVLPFTQLPLAKLISLIVLVVCLVPVLIYSVRYRPHPEEPEPEAASEPERIQPHP